MSEAELHVLKARLRGGVINKVRRGDYQCPLPPGFLYDETGSVILDADTQARETIAHFLETFRRVGSAHQRQSKHFGARGYSFLTPTKVRRRSRLPALSASTAMRTLTSPRYAGAYVYGRRLYSRTIDGTTILRKRPEYEWLACVQDEHPG
jgi:DNA invertase Pin-like site-specific DNA recombinase